MLSLLAWSVLVAFAFALAATAQEVAPDEQHYVADIELQTVEEFRQLLERAEQLLLEGAITQGDVAGVTFVLHGPVVRNLLRQNYLANKKTVDLAASLSAMGVIEVKACRTWMGGHGVNEEDLQPFVETVAYGPGEVLRLAKEKNYIYF